MILPTLDIRRLDSPKLGVASFARRILVRVVFVLLAIAVLTLALVLLSGEKDRAYRSYLESFRKTLAEISARLRHPAGQLALLNPNRADAAKPPLSPLVLPYGALDFDDRYKALQAAEISGCSIRYPDGSSICVAVGNNPYAGGFIYLVGSFNAKRLVARELGALELSGLHRALVNVSHGDRREQAWVAPFELTGEASIGASPGGRLMGFVREGTSLAPNALPQRDFRGWLWQAPHCAGGESGEAALDCWRSTFFSMRLPVESFREALFKGKRPVWPPADLEQTRVHLQFWGPEQDRPLFDSNAIGASAPMALADLRDALAAHEVLVISKVSGPQVPEQVLRGTKREPTTVAFQAFFSGLVQLLPPSVPLSSSWQKNWQAHELIATPAGSYQIRLQGSWAEVDEALSVVAARMSFYVAIMLSAIFLAWLVIELGLLHRVSKLTRRAAALSYNVHAPQPEQRLGALEVADLRGKDELGILAGALADLLQRVREGAQREHLHAQQERDMWHAVGHEIMSPLQSLLALHEKEGDASRRYLLRMQQAVRVLYGQASPSEALQAAALAPQVLDLHAFLRNVASNAEFAGLQNVRYTSQHSGVLVHADEFALEDVVTHVLRNADQYRQAGTAIEMAIVVDAGRARVSISNQGPQIAPDMLTRIFEYGVSDTNPSHAGQRGQGLFVAKTYMAKMGGTISATNLDDGVCLTLTLALANTT